jgi:hypothetical protein
MLFHLLRKATQHHPIINLCCDREAEIYKKFVMNRQTPHTFQIQVVLDLFGKPHLLSQHEKDLLGKAIMNVYNEHVNCPETNFRQVQAVNIVSTTFVDQDVRDFSLSYIVTGSCQGCNSTTTLLSNVAIRMSTHVLVKVQLL